MRASGKLLCSGVLGLGVRLAVLVSCAIPHVAVLAAGWSIVGSGWR